MLDASLSKLMRAVGEVSRGWIPLHEPVLERILQRFDDGTYVHSRAKLRNDLKLDLGLYTYCLRELVNLEYRINEELRPLFTETTESQVQSPGELIKTASLTELKSIISRAQREVAHASLGSMTQFQAIQLHQSMLSAVTSETLATRSALDPEIGFTCGLLRQFGRTLVAWNYPTEYEQALTSLSGAKSFDDALLDTLGFSPQALALTFARRWNMPEQIIAVLSGRSHVNIKQPFARRSSFPSEEGHIDLGRICDIAEAFAQASYPEYFPNAAEQWSSAHSEILKHFGPQGMESIIQTTEHQLQYYQNLELRLPRESSVSSVRAHITGAVYQERLIRKNKHLDLLPEEIKEAVYKIYKRLQPNDVQKDLIRELVKEVLPAAGFTTGCVFLYNSSTLSLAPALGVGTTSYQQIPPVPVFSRASQHHIISSAYSLKAPLRAPRNLNSGATIITIAASIGSIAPIGVLYVETSTAQDKQPLPDAMTVFRALRQCLADCLNLP